MKNKSIRVFTYGIIFLVLFPACKLLAGTHKNRTDDTLTTNAVYLSLMDTMMVRMEKRSSIVSPEVDFLGQMIPHHQGAIAMAFYESGHGKDPGMVQLAKSIAAEQGVEIKLMELWLSSGSLPKAGLPLTYQAAMATTMRVMMDNMMADKVSKDSDKAFAQVMIPHHQAAIDMAKVILKYSVNQQVAAFAKSLISNEEVEIEQMSTFLK